ncbi:MAG: outer membrane lipoprotein chaperone LolA [Deltaproteobacteria bacterium]|nr:outer membrane lipoprotein chaperone LolA [Deltaproteobacteria bacterium]
MEKKITLKKIKNFSRISFLVIFLLICFSTKVLAENNAAGKSAKNITKALNKAYKKVETISALFTQETYNKALNQRDLSSGKIFLKRGGKLRWEFITPVEDVLISNGKKFWVYQDDLAQVILTSVEAGPQGAAIRFLTGEVDFQRDFTSELLQVDGDSYTLSLLPKTPLGSIKTLIIEVGKKDYLIKQSIIEDTMGITTTVGLSDIKTNLKIKDSFFEFIPPKGVKVVRP